MKYLFLMACLFSVVAVFSQPSQKEIKKFKISEVREEEIYIEDSIVNVTETWYDNQGYDTAWVYGRSKYRASYQFDKMNRVEKKTVYDALGFESSNRRYAYYPNGSYRIDFWYVLGYDAEYEVYDSLNRLEKKQLKEGYKLFYDYDNKNRLISVMSMRRPSVKAKLIHLLYTYNGKGNLEKEISKGDEKWERYYTHNAKGQIIKIVRSGEIRSVCEYVYDNKGLISKITEFQTGNSGKKTTITTSYNYVFRK
ncbi:MAG: hypothetical protein IPL84_17405 [Chitinophagaceae bacterium]|nr:hypothetical protein [Chitinophagaceae bacterium]